MRLEEKLANLLGGRDWIGAADSAPWRRDWLDKFGEIPLGIARLASTVQVSEVIKLCASAGVPVVPQGGNTSLVGGAVFANAGGDHAFRYGMMQDLVLGPGAGRKGSSVGKKSSRFGWGSLQLTRAAVLPPNTGGARQGGPRRST